MSNLRLGSRDKNNPIEKKIKLSYEIQFLINPMLKDDNEKKTKKKLSQHELTYQTRNSCYDTEMTSHKKQIKISYAVQILM